MIRLTTLAVSVIACFNVKMPVIRGSATSPATAGELFALIRDGVATTRAELRRLTGLSRTAVAARVSALSRPGAGGRARGRTVDRWTPADPAEIQPDAGVVLSAAIGRSRTRLAVCNLAGDILAVSDLDQEVGLGPDDLIPDVIKRLEALLVESGRAAGTIHGVGLSLPGTVDQQRACSLDSPVMSGWDGVMLEPYFRELTTAPILVDNDANVIALSERAVSGAVRRHAAPQSLHRPGRRHHAGGVLQRGAVGAAGEFGHNKTPAAAGATLPMWGHRVPRSHRRRLGAGADAATAGPRRRAHPRSRRPRIGGEPEARRLIRESGRHIGEVIAGAVNLLNPEIVVIAGDMARAYDILVAGLREALYRNATALSTRVLQVAPTTYGDRSGVIGGAAMILDRILSPGAIDEALRTVR